MKTIYLHVGKHKTGTTSLQRYLYSNIDFFDSIGYSVVTNELFYPDHRFNGANNIYLAHLLIDTKLVTPVRMFAGDLILEDSVDQILEANQTLHSIEHDNLIISAEAFSFLRSEKEKQLLEMLVDGFVVKPMLYLRNKKAWMKAWKEQMSHFEDLIEFNVANTVTDFNVDSWLLDDAALTDFYNVDAYDYERIENTIPHFLHELGINNYPNFNSYWDNQT